MLPSTSPNTFYHIGIMPSWILVQSYVQKHSFLGEIFSPGSCWFVLPFISMHLWITFWGTRLPQDTFLWLWVLSYVQGLLFHFFNQTQEHQKWLKKTIPLWTIMQCFHKRNLAMRTSKSKALQWERRDLLSRMRPKCGPNLDLLQTISRYFHQNAVKSLKSTFCDKSAMLFIMEGLLYHPISIELHVLTLVLNLIDSSLSLFHSFAATFLS